MKIKTITCHDVYNSGASLQAYALMKYLQELGHDVEIINYKPVYLDNHHKLLVVNNPRYKQNIILKSIYIMLKLPGRIFNLKNKKKFDDFKKNYLKITNKKYVSNEDLKKNLPLADAYIAGSDQIWNTVFKNGKDPAFYLDFVPNNKIKISYAASFATESIDEICKENIKKMINKLNSIAVREISGLNILYSMGIKNGVQVVDPVFLLDKEHWNSLVLNKKFKEKYIFVYDFDGSEIIEKLAKKISQEKNIKIYTVFRSPYTDKYIKNIGPKEFITYIKNAEYIISNSFHATAFAIIFKKEFFVINRKEKINTRMRDLLILLKIKNRLIDKEISEINLNNKINYREIQKNLEKACKRSKEYLKKALE